MAVATVALSALAITGTAHAATKGQQLLVCGEGSGYRQVTLEGTNQRGEQTTVSTAFADECTGIPGHWWVGDVKVTLSQPPSGEDSATQWCKVPEKLKTADFVECRVEPRDDTPDPNDGDITDDVSLAIAKKRRDGATDAEVNRFLLDEFGLEEASEPANHPGRDLAEGDEHLALPRPLIYLAENGRYLVQFKFYFLKDPAWYADNQTDSDCGKKRSAILAEMTDSASLLAGESKRRETTPSPLGARLMVAMAIHQVTSSWTRIAWIR